MTTPVVFLPWPASWVGRRWFPVALVGVGVFLLTLSAKYKIPIGGVPFTLQTLVVILLPMLYGFRLGLSTVLSYLALGALGAPVFAGGGGLAYLVGPTGGYLFGFVVAAAFCGWAAQCRWSASPVLTFLILLVGDAVVFACGVAYLAWGAGLGWEKAVAVGLSPFVISDFCKVVIATIIVSSVRGRFSGKTSDNRSP